MALKDLCIMLAINWITHNINGLQLKEAYAVVYALQKLRPYLWGAEFVIFTYKPLKSLFLQEVTNTKKEVCMCYILKYVSWVVASARWTVCPRG